MRVSVIAVPLESSPQHFSHTGTHKYVLVLLMKSSYSEEKWFDKERVKNIFSHFFWKKCCRGLWKCIPPGYRETVSFDELENLGMHVCWSIKLMQISTESKVLHVPGKTRMQGCVMSSKTLCPYNNFTNSFVSFTRHSSQWQVVILSILFLTTWSWWIETN